MLSKGYKQMATSGDQQDLETFSLGLIQSDVLDQEALCHEVTGQSVFDFIICFGIIQVSNKGTEA